MDYEFELIKGTNAAVCFDLSGDADLDMSQIGTMEVYATYPGGTVIKYANDMDVDTVHKTVTVTFTQQETLRMPKNKIVQIVLICMVDGLRRETRPVLECYVTDTPRKTVMY